MNVVTLFNGLDTVEISLRGAPRFDFTSGEAGTSGREWRKLTFDGNEHALFYLRGIVSQGGGIYKLRTLAVEAGVADVWRQRDEQILDRVAILLAAHRLSVSVCSKKTNSEPNGAASAVSRGQTPGRQPRPAATPAALRARAGTTLPAKSALAQHANDLANISHDIQAAALRFAASHGIPFCEMCEKTRIADLTHVRPGRAG